MPNTIDQYLNKYVSIQIVVRSAVRTNNNRYIMDHDKLFWYQVYDKSDTTTGHEDQYRYDR